MRGTSSSQLHLCLWVFSKIPKTVFPECTAARSAWELLLLTQLSTSASSLEQGAWMPTLTWFPRASHWDQAQGIEISWLLPFSPSSATPPTPDWYFLHVPNYSQILALRSTLGEPKLKGNNFKDKDKITGGRKPILSHHLSRRSSNA